MNADRRRFLGTAAATIAGMEFGMLGATKSLLQGVGTRPDRGLAALRHATTWLNSPPLTTAGLRGKVVLVDFCTYTCINWLRTLPYVRAWAEKYREGGLVVIGVHTPEFDFEHEVDNVRRALQAMRVEYPIAVDNEYGIWNGFENQYWPAVYLLDAKGAIRHRQFGEGGYVEAERVIQQLLTEAGAEGVGRDLVQVDARGIEAAADWDHLRSPENYLNSERTEGFVSSGALPPKLRLNEWTVVGDWTVGTKAAALQTPPGRLVCRFHARDLNLVMGPSVRGKSVACRVRIDGHAPAAAHGGDVDEQGQGTVAEQRLYQLIRQPQPIVDRQFEIEFLNAGAEVFCFTFG